MLADILRSGFTIARQRPGLILVDLSWKLLWTAFTSILIFIAVLWMTADLRAIAWNDTGVNTTNGLIAAAVLRDFWLAKKAQGILAMLLVLLAAAAIWISLEALFRRRLVRDISISTLQDASPAPVSRYPLRVFLASGFFRAAMLFFIAVLMLEVSLAGARTIAIVTFVSFAFLLSVLDTLIRADAVELLGTDLIRVAGLLGILMSFESMASAAFVILLLAGFVNVTGAPDVLAMIAAGGLGALLWSVLHSYLLLVRFSAIAIMRRNVIEV